MDYVSIVRQSAPKCKNAMLTRRASRRLLLTAALLTVGWLLAAPALAEDRPPWWDGRWRFRALVRVDQSGPRAGVPAARVWLHIRQDADTEGQDIRVIGPNGQRVPFDIVYAGPDHSYLLAFATQHAPGLYSVYYGNPHADSTPHEAPQLGLIYETRRIPRGADASTWEAASDAIGKVLARLRCRLLAPRLRRLQSLR